MYNVIARKEIVDLINDVNKFLSQGWLLAGGVVVTEHRYYQTIYRPKKEELC